MKKQIRCNHCKTNLELCKEINIYICHGSFAIKCPICGVVLKVKTNKYGDVEIII